MAGGIWGHNIAKMAGITVNMLPAKGALLIFGHRVNNIVLNRCRKPADADILVPGDTISLIGTTSSKVSFDEVDRMYVTPVRWIYCYAKGKNWLRSWHKPVFCGLMRVYGLWLRQTTIRVAGM